MNKNVVVIGAGIGGLCAAIRLAQKGFDVKLLEARASSGGLASGLTFDNFSFDAGPYILLDKPGLYWALTGLGIVPEQALELLPLKHIYKVIHEDNSITAFDTDIEETASGFEAQFKGSAARYKQFVARTFKVHQQLQPLTFHSKPNLKLLLQYRALGCIPFLLRSLGSLLRASGLPGQVQQGIGIWTHIAGQSLSKAPGPMAFVPGLFHHIGSFYPKGGMQVVGRLLLEKAIASGVSIVYNSKVASVQVRDKQVSGVTLENGTVVPADVVVSDAAALSTYIDMLEGFDGRPKRAMEALPLQSPGICIYMAVQGKAPGHYVRFRLKDNKCVAFVQPGLVDETLGQDGWYPARLIAPLAHEAATDLKEEGQQALIRELTEDTWWQEGITGYKILHARTTFEWGKEYNLFRDSMNPVMTAAFMRKGRIAHRSPYAKGLYLAGSATHPGQWVSFCAISGVLAADCVLKDEGHA